MQDSKIETYQKMWRYMKNRRPSVFVPTIEEGVKRVGCNLSNSLPFFDTDNGFAKNSQICPVHIQILFFYYFHIKKKI